MSRVADFSNDVGHGSILQVHAGAQRRGDCCPLSLCMLVHVAWGTWFRSGVVVELVLGVGHIMSQSLEAPPSILESSSLTLNLSLRNPET